MDAYTHTYADTGTRTDASMQTYRYIHEDMGTQAYRQKHTNRLTDIDTYKHRYTDMDTCMQR